MKIYTRTGDDGTTGLFGGERVSKSDLRVAAYGDVDELNATIGVARALSLSPRTEEICARIQSELFVLGAELATVPGKEKNLKFDLVTGEDIARFEHEIDEIDAELEPLKNFVLPGGTPQSAALHVSRTVCRRAERAVLAVSPIRAEVVHYLNRLSDLLFTLARVENARRQIADVPWQPRGA